jgi:hypothetical protein
MPLLNTAFDFCATSRNFSAVDGDSLRYFNPFADIRRTANKLPHWQQAGATYFITYRLADAVPMLLRTQWLAEREAWLAHHPRPWNPEDEREYHVRFIALYSPQSGKGKTDRANVHALRKRFRPQLDLAERSRISRSWAAKPKIGWP